MLLTIGIFKHLLIDRLTFYCFGGGGSSGSSGGNDTLWDAQATSANQSTAMSGEMFDYWKKYSPGYLANANQMTNEAMDGTLTNRARTTAGADADQATAQGLGAANRSLERYGSTMNPNAMASQSNSIALNAAANKAGGMGAATAWGENQKWARNQDANSMTSGMPGSAVAAANTANSSYSSMAGMQNSQNQMDSQNAAGYGKLGSVAASAMFKADGGLVRRMADGGFLGKASEYSPGEATLRLMGRDTDDLSRTQQLASIGGDPLGMLFLRDGGAARVQKYASGGVVHLANGGIPTGPVQGWRERMAAMPMVSRSSSETNPITSTISGAMPTVAMEYAKPYLQEAGTAMKDAVSGMWTPAAEAAADVGGATELSGTIAGTAETAGVMGGTVGSGAAAAGTGAAEMAGVAGGTAASGAASSAAAASAASAATATAAAAEGVGAVAAANAWNPVGWVLGGLALAGAASASSHADGGEIKNLKPGGRVRGLGSETSDSIPAMLSDGEFVLNAGAVKMLGAKKLAALNKKGLQYREDNLKKGVKIPSTRLRVSKGL